VIAESLLAQGRTPMMIEDSRFDDAGGPLRGAVELAIENRVWDVAVEALARWLYVKAKAGEERAAFQALIPFAEALGALATDDLARPLLLNNIGIAYMAENDGAHAREYFERALGEVERAAEPPLELSCVRQNLAMVTVRESRRDSLMRQELDRLERRLGPDHPWALQLRIRYAHYISDTKRSRELLAPACDMFERLHPDQASSAIECFYYLGFLTADLGDRAGAAEILARAASLGKSETVSDELAWDDLAHGYALLYRGDDAAALEALRAVSERFAAQPDKWWARQRDAHARLGMGLAEKALDRRRAAMADLDFAARVFRELRDLNQDVEHDQRLALARAALANMVPGP
jgi:tetratricopeptide (TPR) repeat protein